MAPLPAPSARQAGTDLLLRGFLCAVIGAAVLISPAYIGSPGLRATVAGAWAVGWFGVVLGTVLVVKGALRWRAGRA